jgi:hypothetical protein
MGRPGLMVTSWTSHSLLDVVHAWWLNTPLLERMKYKEDIKLI